MFNKCLFLFFFSSVSILVAAIGVGVAAYALYYIVDIIDRHHDMWPELISKWMFVSFRLAAHVDISIKLLLCSIRIYIPITSLLFGLVHMDRMFSSLYQNND